MIIAERIRFWRKLAQDAATTTPSPAPVGTAPVISVSQIPTFKANLFSVKPEFIQDLQSVINILNKYLYILSGGKVDFSATWKTPSMGPSQFTAGLKNVYGLSKWMYSVLSSNEEPYSIDGLKKITKDLNDTTARMDFPEPKASTFKSEIISASQLLSNKLGS